MGKIRSRGAFRPIACWEKYFDGWQEKLFTSTTASTPSTSSSPTSASLTLLLVEEVHLPCVYRAQSPTLTKCDLKIEQYATSQKLRYKEHTGVWVRSFTFLTVEWKRKKLLSAESQSIASSISRRDAHALPEQRRPLAIWAILRSVCKHRDIWMPVSLICSSKWYFKKAFLANHCYTYPWPLGHDCRFSVLCEGCALVMHHAPIVIPSTQGIDGSTAILLEIKLVRYKTCMEL